MSLRSGKRYRPEGRQGSSSRSRTETRPSPSVFSKWDDFPVELKERIDRLSLGALSQRGGIEWESAGLAGRTSQWIGSVVGKEVCDAVATLDRPKLRRALHGTSGCVFLDGIRCGEQDLKPWDLAFELDFADLMKDLEESNAWAYDNPWLRVGMFAEEIYFRDNKVRCRIPSSAIHRWVKMLSPDYFGNYLEDVVASLFRWATVPQSAPRELNSVLNSNLRGWYHGLNRHMDEHYPTTYSVSEAKKTAEGDNTGEISSLIIFFRFAHFAADVLKNSPNDEIRELFWYEPEKTAEIISSALDQGISPRVISSWLDLPSPRPKREMQRIFNEEWDKFKQKEATRNDHEAEKHQEILAALAALPPAPPTTGSASTNAPTSPTLRQLFGSELADRFWPPPALPPLEN